VTSLSVPLQSIRAGFFINQDWSLEPSLGYSYTKIEGVDGISLLQLGFAGLYHLTPDRTHRQVYVRPFLGFLSASSGGNSNSDEQLGVGVGMKWPKLNGRMAWRGEVNIDHTFDAEVTALNLLFGISFFTR